MTSLVQAWGGIRATLRTFGFADIKVISGLAGFDLTSISNLEQAQDGGASKGHLLTGIDRGFGQMNDDERRQFTTILTEEILARKPEALVQLESELSRLGWTVIQGRLVPIQLLDRDDVRDISEASSVEMLKAALRFRDGDLSGAISAACGAVDMVTTRVYIEKNLGDPGAASFQERCRKSFVAMGAGAILKNELQEIGWEPNDTNMLAQNLAGALNQGAYIMQSLRSKMGDVHGSKPVVKALVFDSIKWALLLIRTIEISAATPETKP